MSLETARDEAGTPMSICDSPKCAEMALRRLDAAGVLPDGLAKRLKIKP